MYANCVKTAKLFESWEIMSVKAALTKSHKPGKVKEDKFCVCVCVDYEGSKYKMCCNVPNGG